MNPENSSSAGNNGYYRMDNRDTNEVKNIVLKFLFNGHWFLLTIGLAVIAAFIYNRYTTPVYEVHSALLVNEENLNSPITALYGRNQGMFQENLFPNRTNIYNQMAVISSTPIISMTLSELEFDVSYYSLGRLKRTEIYKNAPFQVKWNRNRPQIVEGNFFLTINPDNSLTVSIEEENLRVFDFPENRILKVLPEFSFQTDVQPGAAITTDNFSFTVVLNENFTTEDSGNYMFRFHTPQSLISRYKSMFKVSLPDDNSSILHLAVRDENLTKGIDFLNKLIEIYQYSNLEKKNQYANLSIHFIDSQLQNISDSLSISENRLETFRSNNRMIDFSTQSQQLLIQMNELDREYMERESKHKYYTYLKNYIDTNQELETIIAPSSVGIDDPLLNSFIVQLNELINKKSSMTSIRPDSEHPTFVQLNNQIETVKNSLSHSINNIIEQSGTELGILTKRMDKYSTQISRLPATERNFVNFERRYKIDSETYTFLLQKLSEARIAKASNIPDGQILEYPQMKAVVKPQRRKVFSLALMLGMMLPAGFLLIGDFFNNKIRTLQDIKNITDAPVLGLVSLHEKTHNSFTPVIDNPGSRTAGGFLSVRAKLNMLTKKEEHPVIAVTSAISKEGKTFNAINLASSIAVTHKTTVLLDLDLRNSKIAEVFNFEPDAGVVNYVSGQATLEEITFSTKLPKLKIIPTGRIPLNPTELLTDERLLQLIGLLKSKYDAVVINTPPAAFISDIFHLINSIDAIIFIVRHNHTPKEAIKMALEDFINQQIKNIGIIVNQTYSNKFKFGFNAERHGSGYGYFYGNEYWNGNRKVDTFRHEQNTKIQEEKLV